MNIDNAKSQMRKGMLEYCVLLLLHKEPSYASDIISKLKEAQLIVVEGTLYPLLTRLKKDGLLSYEWKESTQGPPRKYYALTSEGENFLDGLERTCRHRRPPEIKITQLTPKFTENEKNITINLLGSLYAIDEDAYELLNQYLNNMKRYFARKEDGAEIADDIEHRIAELLADLKAQGVEAITIEHIEDIIKRIGNPEEMDDEEWNENPEENTASAPEPGQRVGKKLFRNPDDKMLSGVTSGIAAFFGLDTLLCRILMVLFALITKGVMIPIYLLMWLIMPEARTPEERLMMQGKPVNMNNLRDEIINGTKQAGAFISSETTKSKARNIAGTLLNFVVTLFKIGIAIAAGIIMLFLVLGLITTVCFIGIAIYATIAGFGTLVAANVDPEILLTLNSLPMSTHVSFWIAAVTLVIVLSIAIYTSFHLAARIFGKTQPMNSRQSWTLGITWTVALILFIIFTTMTLIQINRTHAESVRTVNTHNGFYVPEYEWGYLKAQKWNIVAGENNEGNFVGWGKFYNGDPGVRYLYAHNRENDAMKFQMEKIYDLHPGTYTLEAVGASDGNGAFIYAQTTDSIYQIEIPVCANNEGGNIWQEAVERNDTTDAVVNNIVKANDGKGYGWNHVKIENIKTDDGKIRVGVSNVSSFTGSPWEGYQLRAAEFKLFPVK